MGRPGLVRTNVRKLIIFIQKYSAKDAIFSIHYSQIENKEMSVKHVEVSFFTVRTNPTCGVCSKIGMGVYLNSAGRSLRAGCRPYHIL